MKSIFGAGKPPVIRAEGAQSLDSAKSYPYDMAKMLELGEQCSLAERRADEATRDVMGWLKCEYMQDHIGDEFDGVVSAVTGFGLFVELTGVYTEGLLHVSALQGDYYHFDAAKQRLSGERTGVTYRLGDEMRVRVVRVDLDDRKIDFELVEAKTSSRKRRAPHKADANKPSGSRAEAKKPAGGSKDGAPSRKRRRSRKPKQD